MKCSEEMFEIVRAIDLRPELHPLRDVLRDLARLLAWVES